MKNFDHISGKYLNTDSARIYFEVIGNEDLPALLVLHGSFGSIEDFDFWLN
ncbi:MAG: hypothetical protein ABI760_19685 [Ferruginibacter sp.]